MKTNIQELVDTADHFCDSLDEMIKNEKQFSINVLIALDQMAYDSRKIAISLMEINSYIQGVI